jgi:hypothetical protein
MATFKQVAAQLRVVAQNVEENVPLLIRKVALAIDQTLVLGTPVDTGRARANWQVTIGAPATGEAGFAITNTKTAVSGANAAAATQFAITAAIKATSGFAGGVIYITNNLPYIIPLNEGHSKQAPAGFVQTAILNGIAAVKSVKLTAKPEGYGNT